MATNPPYQPPPPYGAPMPAQPGPPPPPAFAPPSGGHPADPPRVSPPPPPGAPIAPVKAHPIAWLIPLAGLLALIGVFVPWFRPEVSGQGRSQQFDGLYSWRDGRVGLLPPIVLVVLSVSVIGLLLGKAARGRFSGSADPVKSVAKVSIGAGVGTFVCVVIAWFLVTSQYKFDGMSWDDAEKVANSRGFELARGPQLGFWLTIAAGVVALVGGVLMLVLSKQDAAAPGGAQQGGFPQQVGYPQPQGPGLGQPGAYPQQGGFAQQQPPSFQKPPTG